MSKDARHSFGSSRRTIMNRRDVLQRLSALGITAAGSELLVGGPATALASQFRSNAVQATTSTVVLSDAVSSINIRSCYEVVGMSADDTGQAFDWGYIRTGATISFYLAIQEAGTYSILVSYASVSQKSAASVIVNGQVVGSLAFTVVDGWAKYSVVQTPPITLPQGTVSLELRAQTAGWNFGGLSLSPVNVPAKLPYMLGYLANDTTTQADLASIQGWLGRNLDCCGGTMTLSGWWNNDIPSDVYVCGVAVPMLTLPGWQSFTATDMALAAGGAYDQYYIAAAQALARSNARIYSVRPGWEMNGNWYPWSIGNPSGQNNTAENYVATFQRMVNIFRQYLPGVLIEFCTAWAWGPYTYPPGSDVANAGTPESYWPGSDYVDIVSMDVYESNCGNSWSMVQSGAGVQFNLDWLVEFAEQNNLKVGLSEWGAANDDGQFITSAAAWMNSLGSRFVYSVYSSYTPADQVVRSGSEPNEQAAWIAAWGNTIYAG